MPTRIQAHQWDGLHHYGLWADIPPAAATPSFKWIEVNMRLLTPPFGRSKNYSRYGEGQGVIQEDVSAVASATT